MPELGGRANLGDAKNKPSFSGRGVGGELNTAKNNTGEASLAINICVMEPDYAMVAVTIVVVIFIVVDRVTR